MSNWKNEQEAREEIKSLVGEYYKEFKKPLESKDNFKPGDRISYASRVYDEKEMQSLTDAMLDFWLTTGRFSKEFEDEFAKWIGVRFAHLVNSGSSANLIARLSLLIISLKNKSSPFAFISSKQLLKVLFSFRLVLYPSLIVSLS